MGVEEGRGVQLGTLTAVASQKFNKYLHYPSHRNLSVEPVFYEGITRFSQNLSKMHSSAVLKSTMPLAFLAAAL